MRTLKQENKNEEWVTGEVTTIPGNDITMKGVNYPVLGVSNKGDKKLMMPGRDYKFRGDYVTEYPMFGGGGHLFQDKGRMTRLQYRPQYGSSLRENIASYAERGRTFDEMLSENPAYRNMLRLPGQLEAARDSYDKMRKDIEQWNWERGRTNDWRAYRNNQQAAAAQKEKESQLPEILRLGFTFNKKPSPHEVWSMAHNGEVPHIPTQAEQMAHSGTIGDWYKYSASQQAGMQNALLGAPNAHAMNPELTYELYTNTGRVYQKAAETALGIGALRGLGYVGEMVYPYIEPYVAPLLTKEAIGTTAASLLGGAAVDHEAQLRGYDGWGDYAARKYNDWYYGAYTGEPTDGEKMFWSFWNPGYAAVPFGGKMVDLVGNAAKSASNTVKTTIAARNAFNTSDYALANDLHFTPTGKLKQGIEYTDLTTGEVTRPTTIKTVYDPVTQRTVKPKTLLRNIVKNPMPYEEYGWQQRWKAQQGGMDWFAQNFRQGQTPKLNGTERWNMRGIDMDMTPRIGFGEQTFRMNGRNPLSNLFFGEKGVRNLGLDLYGFVNGDYRLPYEISNTSIVNHTFDMNDVSNVFEMGTNADVRFDKQILFDVLKRYENENPTYQEALNMAPTLSELLGKDHPLIKAYGDKAANVKILVNKKEDHLMNYDTEKNVINVGKSDIYSEDFLRNINHEVQHFIQHEENWSNGGSPDEPNILDIEPSTKQNIEELKKLEETIFNPSTNPRIQYYEKLIAELKQMRDNPRHYHDTELLQNLDDDIKYYSEALRGEKIMMKDRKMIPWLEYEKRFELYDRLSGEVQSRNVQSRFDFSDKQRATIPIEETEDVPIEDKLYRHISDAEENSLSSNNNEMDKLPDYAKPNSRDRLPEEYLNERLKNIEMSDGKIHEDGYDIPLSAKSKDVDFIEYENPVSRDIINEVSKLTKELYGKAIPENDIAKQFDENGMFAITSGGKVFFNEQIFKDFIWDMIGRYPTNEELRFFKSIVKAHEKGHAIGIPSTAPEGFDFSKLPAKYQKYFLKNNGSEIAERAQQIANYYGLKEHHTITPEMLRYAKQNYIKDTFFDNDMTELFNSIVDFEKAAKWMTQNYKVLLPLFISTGMLPLLNQKKSK